MEIVSLIVGGLAAYALGIPWYMALSKPWMAAAGVTQEQIQGTSDAGGGPNPMPFIMALVFWMITSALMHFVLLPAADAHVVMAIESGREVANNWMPRLVFTAAAWASFALLSTILSTMYGMRGLNLIWIDGLYTLAGGLVIAIAFSTLGQM